MDEIFCMLGGAHGDVGRTVPHEDIEQQNDPFYAECRAYGRIASNPQERPIAVACHGFLSIPATQESFFAHKFGITQWDRPQDKLSVREPFRAIVKDLVERTRRLRRSQSRQ